MPDATPPPDAPLDRALAERDRLLHRIMWWEHHRHEALLPIALAAFAVGYGAGWLADAALHIHKLTGYFTGVAALFVAGRVLNRRFDPARLALLDARIATLQRRRDRASGAP